MDILDRLILVENKARDFGFEWPTLRLAVQSVISECAEVEEAIANNESKKRISEEVGDLLYSSMSLCMFLDLDPKDVLEQAINKFQQRMGCVYDIAASKGLSSLKGKDQDFLFEIWNQAKSESYLTDQAK